MAKTTKPKRGRGRPPVPPEERAVQVSVSLRQTDLDALRRLAEGRGVPVSAIVQELVRRWLRRQGRR